MGFGRHLTSSLFVALVAATQLSAQGATGTIIGRVVESATQQPISGASVVVQGTELGTLSRADGGFLLSNVPPGTHVLVASRIGFGSQRQQVSLQAGESSRVEFALQLQAVVLDPLVATGYGTQRREAITGSVATIEADEANVGVVSNPNEMIQGRVPGVQVVQNNGEPGAGMRVRIRGGTSISASNEPLYVIDGVAIENVPTEPRGIGINSDPPLSRSPLALLNPSDIQSITILKDAAATAIYGSRAANGVVLITTKKGTAGAPTMEYDGYTAMSAPSQRLDLLTGDEYRAFLQQQVNAGNLSPDRLDGLGNANTDWERELTRSAVTQNHNLSFSGGSENTLYRASLNYMDQEGVVIDNGFERIQTRLNATHNALDSRLRLGLNLNVSHMDNDYLPYENTGGFEGGVFTNMVIFNPTQPVHVTDPSTGELTYYETGTGRQSTRNPVAIAEQVLDFGTTTRTLGNVTAALDLLPGVTAQLNLGADRSSGTRRTYLPKASPVGAEFEGRARQVNRDNTALTLQSFVTVRRQFGPNGIDLVGGYEFNEYSTAEFGSEGRGFLTDAFGYHNLGSASELVRPQLEGGRQGSWREDSRLVSFFSRATYDLADRYFLTGVLRYDGSSRFGAGNKWALFPAISASWRISEEDFMPAGVFSDLRLRAGYGLQGNPAVPPYASLLILGPGGNYVFGDETVVGIVPTRNANPNLKWEQTAQFNLALDYGLWENRVTGTAEYYVKNTSDLLLEVPVPQPALVDRRLENIGRIRNRGVELSVDAVAVSRPALNLVTGLVFSAEQNEVVDLGGRSFINTGFVSGQGQSGQVSQRIMPGEPLGTFFGPTFAGVDAQGRQLFRCDRADADCVDGQTRTPTGDDYGILGDANPDYSLGFRGQADWGRLDLSFLVRRESGHQVFNNTALVYSTKSNVLQGRNFLKSALEDPIAMGEPAIYSSRWIEDASFTRVQNVTLGYTFDLPRANLRGARVYASGDNLLLMTGYDGYDPEVHTEAGLASLGIDYLNYPRPRTVTAGIRFMF
jgi:TonB-linked SusC/RagA family outer membrane protein